MGLSYCCLLPSLLHCRSNTRAQFVFTAVMHRPKILHLPGIFLPYITGVQDKQCLFAYQGGCKPQKIFLNLLPNPSRNNCLDNRSSTFFRDTSSSSVLPIFVNTTDWLAWIPYIISCTKRPATLGVPFESSPKIPLSAPSASSPFCYNPFDLLPDISLFARDL